MLIFQENRLALAQGADRICDKKLSISAVGLNNELRRLSSVGMGRRLYRRAREF